MTSLYDVLKYKTSDETKLRLLEKFDTVLDLDLLAAADKKRQEMQKQAAAAPQAGGLALIPEETERDEAVEQKILERAQAKKQKDFARADAIRAELKAQGIELTDIPGGVKYKRA